MVTAESEAAAEFELQRDLFIMSVQSCEAMFCAASALRYARKVRGDGGDGESAWGFMSILAASMHLRVLHSTKARGLSARIVFVCSTIDLFIIGSRFLPASLQPASLGLLWAPLLPPCPPYTPPALHPSSPPPPSSVPVPASPTPSLLPPSNDRLIHWSRLLMTHAAAGALLSLAHAVSGTAINAEEVATASSTPIARAMAVLLSQPLTMSTSPPPPPPHEVVPADECKDLLRSGACPAAKLSVTGAAPRAVARHHVIPALSRIKPPRLGFGPPVVRGLLRRRQADSPQENSDGSDVSEHAVALSAYFLLFMRMIQSPPPASTTAAGDTAMATSTTLRRGLARCCTQLVGAPLALGEGEITGAEMRHWLDTFQRGWAPLGRWGYALWKRANEVTTIEKVVHHGTTSATAQPPLRLSCHVAVPRLFRCPSHHHHGGGGEVAAYLMDFPRCAEIFLHFTGSARIRPPLSPSRPPPPLSPSTYCP